MRALVMFAILAVAGVAAAQDGTADTLVYRVKPNDTLPLIAAEYYGDRTKAVFIMVENKITHPRPLRPGERLRIPVNREITTAPGETFTSLAETYLGNPRRGSFLAEFNGMGVEDRLPAGTLLQVPFTVRHTAAANETLASIGAAYFNDNKQGEMLRRYNFLDKNTLEKGESIIVPIFNVRLQASKMPPVDPDAKSRRAARREAAQKGASAIPKAWQAWRVGDFARIETLLVGIEPDYLDTAEAVDVGVLRGLSHLAEGKTELAQKDFEDALARKRDHVLRKFEHSPKILDLWTKAGGQVE